MEGWDGKGNNFGLLRLLSVFGLLGRRLSRGSEFSTVYAEPKREMIREERSCRIPSRRARHAEMEEKKPQVTGELRHPTSACLLGRSTPAAERKTVVAARHAGPVRAVTLQDALDALQTHGRGAPNKPFCQPVIGRFMSLLVMWNLGRASKGPRNKHHDNMTCPFRSQEPARSPVSRLPPSPAPPRKGA